MIGMEGVIDNEKREMRIDFLLKKNSNFVNI